MIITTVIVTNFTGNLKWQTFFFRSRDIENGGVGALHVVGVQAVLTEYLIRYTDIIFSEKMPVFPTLSVGEGNVYLLCFFK